MVINDPQTFDMFAEPDMVVIAGESDFVSIDDSNDLHDAVMIDMSEMDLFDAVTIDLDLDADSFVSLDDDVYVSDFSIDDLHNDIHHLDMDHFDLSDDITIL